MAEHDLEERIKMFLNSEQIPEQDHYLSGNGDSFAERAEWFFRKRPQLLSLLQDLYNAYLTLLDRCNKLEGKNKIPPSSLLSSSSSSSAIISRFDPDNDDWDSESSVSFQQTSAAINNPEISSSSKTIDELVAELVMKNVEEDLMKIQVFDMENQCQEFSRKIDLLKKLLEVLESERILLLNENGRLEYKLAGMMQENQGLNSEAMFLKKKSAQLARCVLQMRENHKVCLLTRKIEDLQSQIYGLEERNKEYYQQLLRKENPEKEAKSWSSPLISQSPSRRNKNKNGGLMGCFQMVKKINEDDNNLKIKKDDYGSKRGSNWWDKVKKTTITTTTTAITPFAASCSSSFST